MNTHEIIAMAENELVAELKKMPTDLIEHHTQQILEDLGCTNYSKLMGLLVKLVSVEQQGSVNKFEQVKNFIEESLPNKAFKSDIYGRVSAMIMIIINRKFQAIYQGTSD